MHIAIASGKGGTGKTTVAVNLAIAAVTETGKAAYVDCDVEEPNGHIFLRPRIESSEQVGICVPVIDTERCSSCGECSDFCRFKAIATILDRVLTFPELCHGCGGCARICPEGAITEIVREIGKVESGYAVLNGHPEGSNNGALRFVHGVLNVREVLSPPVIRKVWSNIPDAGINIIDAPPGASCPMVESVREADYVLLVTEPTPFGLNDLAIAVETVRKLEIPCGVAINRADIGDSRTKVYCRDEGIDVLAEIPDSRRVAETYALGEILCGSVPDFSVRMSALLHGILEREACG